MPAVVAAVAEEDIAVEAAVGEDIEAAVECRFRPADRLQWVEARAHDRRHDLRLVPQGVLRVDPPDRPPAQAARCVRERGL